MLTTVNVPTPDGTADARLAFPDGAGPHPGVLFFMDAFGVRPRLEEMAQQIADAGYVVLLPNLVYRSGRAPVVDFADLSQPENREKMFAALRPIMSGLTTELALRDIEAYVDYLTAQPSVAAGPIGTTGYCMGGALSLRAAAQLPDRVAAAASFHGGRLATDAADSPHRLADRISAELYLAHADSDHSMPAEQIELLEHSLDAAGVTYRSEVYRGAVHGFTMADTAAYDESATERHWTALLELLDRQLHPARA
jgi:carboxymethylenebutenolidase